MTRMSPNSTFQASPLLLLLVACLLPTLAVATAEPTWQNLGELAAHLLQRDTAYLTQLVTNYLRQISTFLVSSDVTRPALALFHQALTSATSTFHTLLTNQHLQAFLASPIASNMVRAYHQAYDACQAHPDAVWLREWLALVSRAIHAQPTDLTKLVTLARSLLARIQQRLVVLTVFLYQIVVKIVGLIAGLRREDLALGMKRARSLYRQYRKHLHEMYPGWKHVEKVVVNGCSAVHRGVRDIVVRTAAVLEQGMVKVEVLSPYATPESATALAVLLWSMLAWLVVLRPLFSSRGGWVRRRRHRGRREEEHTEEEEEHWGVTVGGSKVQSPGTVGSRRKKWRR
jgi:hypothetical protein